MLSINKRNVNIIAYYTSRFLDAETNEDVVENASYSKLGFQTRTEFHLSIANQFGVKQSYVKNMEDSYDSIHGNHRRGWHQRDLRPAQQQIVDTLSQKDEDELFAMVKSLTAVVAIFFLSRLIVPKALVWIARVGNKEHLT